MSIDREFGNEFTDVYESAKYIAENSQDVFVNEKGCESAALKIYTAMKDSKYSTEKWDENPLNPKSKDKSTVDWIFTIDLLNFSFWSDIDTKDNGSETKRYTVLFNNKKYTGYWSLVAAIDKALQNGIPITTPSYWVDEKFNEKTLEHIFKSDSDEQIPLLSERYKCLKEAGEVLTKKYNNSFTDCIKKCDKSAMKLVNLLCKEFNSFNDVSIYKSKKVCIHKRAQILVADLWACFNGKSYGEFYDIEKITMFADYRVPQILHTLGCISYSKPLEEYVKSLKNIPHGSDWEIELRGCSIWAVELIKKYIQLKHDNFYVNSILIDFYLWDTAKETQSKEGIIPCHRTRSIFY